ncbi:MAG: hypothetical protein FJX03_02815 [Alphaproteobacteria bacterium]|nr:hypothetical protein [Alphaproteobacteria bacterium]
MYKILGIGVTFLLSACTTDPVSEEAYEAPQGQFPLLGNIPNRDSIPPFEDISLQQKRLRREIEEASQKQTEILKSEKKLTIPQTTP